MNLRKGLIGLIWMALAASSAAGQEAAALPAGARVEKDVVYGVIEGKELKLDVYYPAPGPTSAPAGPRELIMRISPVREPLSAGDAAWLTVGSQTVLVYAGYLAGEPRDRVFAKFPQDVEAAKAAVRWARGNAARLVVAKDRIGLVGAGPGATVAALLSVTADQKGLNGKIGDFLEESSAVRAVCLFGGTTDWRNAELYGDEMVNVPGSPAYQLFGGNPKEHQDEARLASAVNYVRPSSPATLMVTQASDEMRAMHLIYAETLRRAGVASALYEEEARADTAKLNRTVAEFFADTLATGKVGAETAGTLGLEQEIDKLAKAGLYKQARRLIDEAMAEGASGEGGEGGVAATQRGMWLKKLRQIGDMQQEPAIQQLVDARKRGVVAEGSGAGGATAAGHTIWTIREVLTDPERIGQYMVEASVPQRVFDNRADALRNVELLNGYVLKGDMAGAERQAVVMRAMVNKGEGDSAILNEFLARYAQINGKTAHVWPPGVRGVSYASDSGQDLYGYWFDIKAGGVVQRMRYIPPGKFAMGSGLEEWGRLPGERILEPTAILEGFWLGESEVTQAMYEGVMGVDQNPSRFKGAPEVRLKLPAENLSYAHAMNFLVKLGAGGVQARLPSDAEWEYACRAGSRFMYSGTGRLSDMGWYWDNARQKAEESQPATQLATQKGGDPEVRILHDLEMDSSGLPRVTHPVKTKLPNPWGLYDMQGNVWEWCSGVSATKPRNMHVTKGGSWQSIEQSCRAAREAWLPTELQAPNLGMRICISAQ